MPMTDKESASQWMRANVRPDPRSLKDDDAPASSSSALAAVSEAAHAAIDYREERARRERAEADLAELKLAELRGELLRREIMEKTVGELAARLKESVLQVKSRLAPLLAAETDAAKVSTMLDEELRKALDTAAG